MRDSPDTGALIDPMVLGTAERLGAGGVWTVDVASGATACSPGMRHLHGLTPREPVPTLASFPALVHPADRERIGGLLGVGPAPPAEPIEVGYRLFPGRIGVEHLLLRTDTIEVAGRPTWLALAQDVGSQRKAERATRLHAEVHRGLRGWEAGIEGIDDLLGRLARVMEVPIAALWTVDTELDRMVGRTVWCAPRFEDHGFAQLTLETAMARGQGVAGHIWATGEPQMGMDISHLEATRRAAAAKCGITSGAAFAVMHNGEPFGVIAFYGTGIWAHDADLLDTLTGIGDHLGRFLAPRAAELGRRVLSARELEVLVLAAEGLTTGNIATRLSLEPSTVKTHLERIYAKLDVPDRAAAVAVALRTGLMR